MSLMEVDIMYLSNSIEVATDLSDDVFTVSAKFFEIHAKFSIDINVSEVDICTDCAFISTPCNSKDIRNRELKLLNNY